MAFEKGNKVQIIERDVTEEDKKSGRYYSHMSGLRGTIQNIYSEDEVAVKVDIDSLDKIIAGVHKEASMRMRQKFLGAISEEQKSMLSSEELNFTPHYMLLVKSSDLQKI